MQQNVLDAILSNWNVPSRKMLSTDYNVFATVDVSATTVAFFKFGNFLQNLPELGQKFPVRKWQLSAASTFLTTESLA